MNLPRMRLLIVVLWVAAAWSGASVAQMSEAEKTPEAPKRPDLSALTPEQAATAMSQYRKAQEAWEQAEAPGREAAIKAAIAAQEARKKLIADPAWKAPAEKPRVEVGPGYDWDRDAQAHGLDKATRTRLRRDGLVIAGPDFPQSFSIYGDESLAPFVTSDSLLNGFHVLFETTLRRFELRRAERLRTVLEASWQNLDHRLVEEKVARATIEPYARHLALVLGPALRLLGSTAPLGDPALEAEVSATVDKIVDAKAVELPAWLAPSEPSLLALDFRRCRPLGFYTDSPTLADYYRAVRWLQLVPLRASRENEVGAATLMAELEPRNESESLSSFVEAGAQIWGAAEDLDVVRFRGSQSEFLAAIAKEGDARKALAVEKARIVSMSRRHRSAVNDRLRSLPAEGDDAGSAAVLILAPSVLPDATLLAEIAEARPAEQPWPQGLEVAAWLGSDFALQQLATRAGPELAAAINERRNGRDDDLSLSDSVPDYYYDTLRALFEAPDPAAPKFMSSEAWQRKSLQTVLAGWAQLRHAWELQAKLNISYACGHRRPAGLIEPNPEFFRRMGKLVTVLITRLQAARVFEETPSDEIDFLRNYLRLIDRVGFLKVDTDWEAVGAFDEVQQIGDLIWIACGIDRNLDPAGARELQGAARLKWWRQLRDTLQARISRLEKGERLPPIDSYSMGRDPDHQLFLRWQALQTLTARLEAMVQKQLRHADWNEDEARLIKEYGEELGMVMGYFSSAAMNPKDDAPRWTTVHHDPAVDRQLAVAIGRPRALYVLYPWKGQTILCRGAVMPYYEYPSEQRLTDAEWKTRLDSPNAPEPPDWIRPLVTPAPQK